MRAYMDALNGVSPPKELWEKTAEYFYEHYGDITAYHQWGRFTKAASESAQEQILKYFRRENLAIAFSPVISNTKGKILIPAGSNFWKVFAHSQNLLYECLPMDGYEVSADKTEQILRNAQITLAIIPFAESVTGTIQPVAEIANLCKKYGVMTLCDISAVWGRNEIDFSDISTDYIYLRGTSWGAPLGLDITVGAEAKNSPYALVALKIAVELMMDNLAEKISVVKRMSDEFVKLLNMHIPGVHLLRGKSFANGILCLAFEDVDRQAIGLSLDMQGVAVDLHRPWDSAPEVLLAMGIDSQIANCAITMSLWHNTTEEELEYVLRVLPPLVDRVRFEKKLISVKKTDNGKTLKQ